MVQNLIKVLALDVYTDTQIIGIKHDSKRFNYPEKNVLAKMSALEIIGRLISSSANVWYCAQTNSY